MSSTRVNWKTGLVCVSPQCSSTHCGPSSPMPFGSRCHVPSFGGSGYPLSAAISSLPSGACPVATSFGTFTKRPVTLMLEPTGKS